MLDHTVRSRSSKLSNDRVGEVKYPCGFSCGWCVCSDHVSEVGAGVVEVARLKRCVGIHEIDVFFGGTMVVVNLEAS